ncbi:MAG: small, acid-soluble spore protein, alpha/beta type [Clostridia bacterium]|jgi:uncharacterized membrane protein YkgB|nr:small, acid-soluble spore protein, alpha/beta type [Clostridia bacterium]MCI1999144.1 small, acid-soluble spore protein, alpha/beta type [Clostridia bacterium]MCI2013894.1 small, acid-soluble spore protein, alpha/beta type [Clostridia bacterium]
MKRQKTKEEIERENLIFEMADELGLSEKIVKEGLRGLTSKESGKIGGLISAKIRKEKKK